MAPTGYSAIEERKLQINRQVDHLRSQLATKTRRRYKSDHVFAREQRRARALLEELEAELSALNFPEEYEELPAAVVAEELGLTNEELQRLIKLGEVEYCGDPAHARINRGELARLAAMGSYELLRLSEQESWEIFETCGEHLQSGDLTSANTAYRRLEARESWRGTHAPAYLVALELARDEHENALTSFKYILALTDEPQRATTIFNLDHLLRKTKFRSVRALKTITEILRITQSYLTDSKPAMTNSLITDSTPNTTAELILRASYFAYAVHREVKGLYICQSEECSKADGSYTEHEFFLLVRNAIYTVLYAEATGGDSELSRTYLNILKQAMPAKTPAPKLLANIGHQERISKNET